MEHNLNLGQHFLKDEKILNIMIESAELSKNECVLEIGAGNGVLTRELAKKCKNVQVLEIDERLKKFLNPLERIFTNVKITYVNALSSNFTEFPKIVTSLPYNIIEPFIHKCIKDNVEFILMLIGDKYALSLAEEQTQNFLQTLTKTYYNCELIAFVPKESFSPPPRTGSYVVRLKRKQELKGIDFLFNEIFSQTDKKIKNALIETIIRFKMNNSQECTKRQAKEILNTLNIDEKILNSYLDNLNNKDFELLYSNLNKLC